jgi:hypothetical protein
MKYEYAIFQGGRCVGFNLYASSMNEINKVIAELNTGESKVKFTSHIVAIKAGV